MNKEKAERMMEASETEHDRRLEKTKSELQALISAAQNTISEIDSDADHSNAQTVRQKFEWVQKCLADAERQLIEAEYQLQRQDVLRDFL